MLYSVAADRNPLTSPITAVAPISMSNLRSRLSNSLRTWLRRDGLAILLFAIATLVMTYPIAFNLNNSWIASYNEDTYMKLWDSWWLNQIIRAGQPLNFTPTLFYPGGLDLTFHSISWTVSGIIWLLTPLLGPIGAYNFSILLAIFTTAYAGYLLIQSMVKHRTAAWLGGAVYSFIPYHMTHSGGHPDLVHLAAIPLAVLLIMRAFSSNSWKSALGAALMLGLAAFTSLYIMVFAGLTLIPVVIYLAFQQQRWRTASFWKIAALFGCTAGIVVGLRILPIFHSTQALSTAIEQKYEADVRQTDLLAFIVPSRFNPLFATYVTGQAKNFRMNYKWPAYLGIVPLALCVVAAAGKRQRRLAWLWLVAGLLFLLLSLGPVLRFDGEVYDNIPLPASWLTWFSPLRAVRPDYFVLCLALPLAVCAGLGLDRLLDLLDKKPRAKGMLAVLVCGLLLIEYWNGPFQGVPAAVSPFYARLAQEPAPSAVIDLPMGREESKMYLYLQTIHQQPLVEGLSGRTPTEAYDYIRANPLLTRLRFQAPPDCQDIPVRMYTQALNQLALDHFKYVIVHHEGGNDADQFVDYLTTDPVYADDSITVYAIADLQASPPCTNPKL